MFHLTLRARRLCLSRAPAAACESATPRPQCASASAAGAAIAVLAHTLLGGRTGDTLGAAVLGGEVVVYSALAAAYWAA